VSYIDDTSLRAPDNDGFGGAVGGAGRVEVGQDVAGTLLEGPPEPSQLGQCCRDSVADGLDQRRHQIAPVLAVGFAVGADHPLVDAPGRLDLDMLLDREQGRQPGALLVGEQVRAGVQGPPGPVQRVVLAAAVPVEVLLDPAAALVQRVTGTRTT
jgi:hypothetical protein